MRAGSDGKGPLQYAVSRLSAVSVSVCAASPLRMTCDRWSHGEWWGGRRSQRRKIIHARDRVSVWATDFGNYK
jgi:hypothetical protein